MTTLDFKPETFDAVVSFYSIIHVPREEHLALIDKIALWLKPGGSFLATWPLTAWEGTARVTPIGTLRAAPGKPEAFGARAFFMSPHETERGPDPLPPAGLRGR